MAIDNNIIKQAEERVKEIQTSTGEAVNASTPAPPSVYPSIYSERQSTIGTTGMFADYDTLDYTAFKKYFMSNSEQEDGIASDYAIRGEESGRYSINSKFSSIANLFEARGYAINDILYSMNNTNLNGEEKELMSDFMSLLVGDRTNEKFRDFYDLIDTAKNFKTFYKRYNHEENEDISFIIDDGTTNTGLNNGWSTKLSGWGIDYSFTNDGNGKVSIPITNLNASPFFAYSFIECYDNDYTDPTALYDDSVQNTKSNNNYFDSWFHRAGNRNQLISINNVTNDREDGTYEYYHNIIEDVGDFLYGSPQYRTRMKEYDDVIKNNSLSREQIERIAGISWDDYDNERNNLSYKYDDSNIISAFRPVHDAIKFGITRMGYPQIEAMQATTFASENALNNDLTNAQIEGLMDSKLLTPAVRSSESIKKLIGKTFLNPNSHITMHSANSSSTEAFTEVRPEDYSKLLKYLNRALSKNGVVSNMVQIPSAVAENNQIELEFDVELEDKEYRSNDIIHFEGGPISLGSKKGTDRWRVRFPASIVKNSQTEALNNTFITTENQLKYMHENGGQLTMLSDIIPESKDIRLEFTNENTPIRLIYGTNIRGENYSNVNEQVFDIPKERIGNLAKAVALSKGLKSTLYQARFLKDTYGEDSDLFKDAKDVFNTQLGEFIQHLTTTFYDPSLYSNDDGSINVDAFIELANSVKVLIGLCDENGNDFDLFDTDRILRWEQSKRTEKNARTPRRIGNKK